MQIKMNNIICLDFDDCIFPSSAPSSFWESEWSLEQLEINLKRLTKLIYETKSTIFITSSWYMLFDFYPEENSVYATNSIKEYWLDYHIDGDISSEEKAYKLISKYLNGYISGISCGNRISDIKELDTSGNRIVVFDDWNLTECNSNNVKCFDVYGSLNYHILWKAYNFLKGK